MTKKVILGVQYAQIIVKDLDRRHPQAFETYLTALDP